MATFKVMPGNKLQLVDIEGHQVGLGPFEPTGPARRIGRAAARAQPVPAGTPGAAPVGAVPAMSGAPVAAQPNFASSLMQRFRQATGRR